MRQLTLDPGRKIGITSDTHYGHAGILTYCLRPWLSEDELARVQAGYKVSVSAETLKRHDDAIVERCNELLGPDDVLIHAGDVAWQGLPKLMEYRERLRVREIHVVTGNHDDVADLTAVFGNGCVYERLALSVGGQLAVVDHYPGDRWHQSHNGSYLLFGHVHGALNAARRTNPAYALSIDVGVDSHDFRPCLWPELRGVLEARRETFKRWAARAYPGKECGGMAPIGSP